MINRGIKFDNIHSFNDLNLVLSPFVPTPAIPKTNYVDIPGGNGSLDLTEAHGEVKYNDRDFKFTFTVHPSDKMTFDEKVTQVSNLLNGKKCKITLDRDSGYYWDGRCIVNEYLQDKNLKQIVIQATVRPYKLKKDVTEVSFDLTADAQEITLTNSRKSIVPEITCTDDETSIVYDGTTYILEAGTHEILNINLMEGENKLTVYGTGKITFKYQEGVL